MRSTFIGINSETVLDYLAQLIFIFKKMIGSVDAENAEIGQALEAINAEVRIYGARSGVVAINKCVLI